jgi:hypothetical protein
MSLAATIRRHDPDGTARRRAARATLVVPVLFAVTLAVGSDVAALYVLFGAFSQLVFGDYGGPAPLKAGSYLATTVVGLVLIVVGTAVSEYVWLAAVVTVVVAFAIIGTAVSEYVWLAAVVTVVVAFAISLAGVLGPAVTKLRTPLLLAFVLPASVAGPLGDVGPRLAGWAAAGVVSLVAAFVLFPRRDVEVVAEVAAEACDQLAAALAAGHRAPAVPLDRLEAAKALATASAFTPTARRRTFVVLIQELQSFERFLATYSTAPHGDAVEHDRLAGVVTATLRHCAAGLRRDGDPPDVEALDRARAQHRDALQAWAERALAAGRPATEVLDELDAERPLRMLSNITLGVAAACRIVCGAPVPAEWSDVAPRSTLAIGGEGGTKRSLEVVGAHLSITSVRFRDALRAGIAFGLAVFVAGQGGVQHGFWVVLGALTVLRTSVLAGGRSAVQAIGGTVIGFVAVVPIVWLIGSGTAIQWLVLPLCAFIAAFAAGVLPYAVGQAAFTVFVVVAVNIIQPNGWRTGFIRVQDVIIGAAVALVTGLLFWPRGARLQARAAIGDLYVATAAIVASAFGHVLDGGSRQRQLDDDHDDRRVLGLARAAVSDLSAERGHLAPGVAAAARLVATAASVRACVERIALLHPIHRAAPAPVLADVDSVVGTFRGVASALTDGGRVAAADPAQVSADRHSATAKALAVDIVSPDAQVRTDAFTVVWAGEWVVDLTRITADLAEPVAELAGRRSRTG